MRTRALLLGIAALAALSTACTEEATRDAETGEIDDAGEVDVFSFELGDCFNSGEVAEGATSGETFEVGGVTGVPCDEPHYAEVYNLVDMDDGDFPGDQAAEDEAVEVCTSTLEDYVAEGWDPNELEVGGFWPTAQTWEDGDREIVCYAYNVDESELVGELDEPAEGEEDTGDDEADDEATDDEGGEMDVFSFELGDCFNSGQVQEDSATGETFEVGGVTGVPCDEPHYAEVYNLVDMDDGDFPGDQAAQDEAVEVCTSTLEDYAGAGWDLDTLEIGGFWPTAATWAEGDREIVCYAYTVDGSDLTGSLADAA